MDADSAVCDSASVVVVVVDVVDDDGDDTAAVCSNFAISSSGEKDICDVEFSAAALELSLDIFDVFDIVSSLVEKDVSVVSDGNDGEDSDGGGDDDDDDDDDDDAMSSLVLFAAGFLDLDQNDLFDAAVKFVNGLLLL